MVIPFMESGRRPLGLCWVPALPLTDVLGKPTPALGISQCQARGCSGSADTQPGGGEVLGLKGLLALKRHPYMYIPTCTPMSLHWCVSEPYIHRQREGTSVWTGAGPVSPMGHRWAVVTHMSRGAVVNPVISQPGVIPSVDEVTLMQTVSERSFQRLVRMHIPATNTDVVVGTG